MRTNGDRAKGRGAEGAQGASDLPFRLLAELSSEALLAVRDGRVAWANDAAALLVGETGGGALEGRTPAELVTPDGASTLTELLTVRTGAMARGLAFLRADGSRVDVEAVARAAPDGTILLAARDASAERRYRELFDKVPVGVWLEDFSGAKPVLDALRAQGVSDLAEHFRAHPEVLEECVRKVKVLDVNATACSQAGARDKEELLANLDKVLPPEAIEGFTSELVQLAAGRRDTVSEGWNGRLDGGKYWIAVRGVLEPGHEHDWSRVLVTTADITERHLAREEKLALQDRLHHAAKLEAVGRLAGGVAHDFNNLLAAILSFAETSIQEVPPGGELHESLVHIREAALRARDLVRQILTFSRRDRPRPWPVDVPAVVGQALSLARAAIPTSVAVEARVDPEAGTALIGATELHQIVLNLCSNARDAVRDRGRIEVAVEAMPPGAEPEALEPGRYVRIRVQDDGVGMDQATRERLFEPYLTTKGGGHGLGLAVVHGIVAAASGAVLVESVPGQGSTFDVYLPRLPDTALQEAGAAGELAAEDAPRGRGRILLVDDEPLVRKGMGRTLRSLGYEVTEAADGFEALRTYRADPTGFAMVLTDQTMPRLTGAELSRMLLAEWPATRIILCSGYTETMDEPRARALGVRAFLAKPLERSGLADVLARVVGESGPA